MNIVLDENILRKVNAERRKRKLRELSRAQALRALERKRDDGYDVHSYHFDHANFLLNDIGQYSGTSNDDAPAGGGSYGGGGASGSWDSGSSSSSDSSASSDSGGGSSGGGDGS